MPQGIAIGKFHGAITAATPRRHVAHRVALARHLQELVPAFELDRLARVVLEEVDRLADVARPPRPTASRTRAPRARPGRAGGGAGGPRRARGSAARSSAGVSAQRRRNGGRRLDRGSRLGGAGAARDRDDPRRASPGRSTRSPPPRPRPRRPGRAPRAGAASSRRPSASVSTCRFDARRSSSSGSFANGFTAPPAAPRRDAARLLVQERLVRGVLEQAAHEVRHPRDQVAHRAVGAHAALPLRERVREVVAQAAQHLDLEVASSPGVGDRVRDRAQVVRRDRHAHERARVEQPPRELLEVAVAVGLALEDRRVPAVLARLDHLVVPVGALHEPDDERRAALRRRAPTRGSGRAPPASRAGTPGARARPTGRRGTRPRRAARRRARAWSRASRATPCPRAGARPRRAPARAAAAAARRRRRGPSSGASGRSAGVSAETLTDRFGCGAPGPRRHRARQRLERLAAPLGVAVRLGGRHRRLAEQVDRREHAVVVEAAQRPERVLRRLADDEAVRHVPDAGGGGGAERLAARARVGRAHRGGERAACGRPPRRGTRRGGGPGRRASGMRASRRPAGTAPPAAPRPATPAPSRARPAP